MNSSPSPLAAPQQSAVLARRVAMRSSLRWAPALTPRLGLLVGMLTLAACTPDVGPCDPFAAREVVYLNTGIPSDASNGTPMFAGQALMQTSCGNGRFCHSNDANAANRFGVPVGLDFDLSVPCDSSGCLPGALPRLRANQQVAFDVRHHILRTLERGSMPPGRLGDDIRAEAGTYVHVDTSDAFFVGGVANGEPLPDAESREGRRIIANWLSCGLPVVERYEVPSSPQDSGRNCRGSTDCVYRVEALADPPVPHWPSIYQTLIGPFCGASCHGPGAPDNRDESQLDLGNIELAYQQLVNRIATGQDCIGEGATLLIPGDPDNSLLIDKMENNSPSCGDPMPSGTGRLFPPEFMAVIRQWITEGAPEACFDATFGASPRVAVAANPLFSPPGSFSLEAWVAPTAAAAQQVIVARQGLAADSSLGYVLALDASGRLEASLSATGATASVFVHPTALTTGEYHHVAMVLDVAGEALTLYVDGVPEEHAISGAAAARANTRPFTIGDYDTSVGSAPFGGVISDVRLTDGLRYVVEAGQDPPGPGEALFTPSTRLMADASTLALYPMHEGGAATMFQDLSVNALHASVAGSVTFAAVACR